MIDFDTLMKNERITVPHFWVNRVIMGKKTSNYDEMSSGFIAHIFKLLKRV